MEDRFQSHIIDSTIFQTNSFDFLSYYSYSDELLHESEKMSQQNERTNLFHLNKFIFQFVFQ